MTFLLGLTFLCSGSPAEETIKASQKVVVDGSTSYTLQVGGNLDEENTWNYGYPFRVGSPDWKLNDRVTILNVGDSTVFNPDVLVNDHGPAYSMDELLDQVVEPGFNDEEKARAIYRFMRDNVVHSTIRDGYSEDPLRLYMALGVAICDENSAALAKLLGAAGLEVFWGAPFGHSTAIVRYGNKNHLLDGNIRTFFLGRDNETVLGEMDLVADPDLVLRSTTHWPTYLLNRGRYPGSLLYQTLQVSAGPRTKPRDTSLPPPLPRFWLRPDEQLTWDFSSTTNAYRFTQIAGAAGLEHLYASGRIDYRVPVDDSFLHQEGVSWDGSNLQIETVVPTLLTGGSFFLTTTGIPPRATLSFGGTFSQPVTWEDRADSWQFSLDPILDIVSAGAPKYDRVILALHCDEETPLGALVSYGHSLSFQVQWKALPRLRRGENRIIYRDESSERKVRITHRWRESTALSPPSAPIPDGPSGTIHSLQPRFRWHFASQQDRESIRQVHIQVFDRDDLLWPVSNALNPLYTTEGDSEFTVSWTPHRPGLLTSGKSYSWRVRCRNEDGVWSNWSPVTAFVPYGPAPPTNLRVETTTGTVVLRWDPSTIGTRPVAYEVHGSRQFGFTAYVHDRVFLLGDRTPPMRTVGTYYEDYPTTQGPTLIGVTTDTLFQPLTEGVDPLPVFCRVVAVDAQGARSDSSRMAELPHPWPVGPDVVRVNPGESFSFAVRANDSLGRYYAKSTSTATYHCDFWDKETLAYSIELLGEADSENPADWISISQEGWVKGKVPADAVLPLKLQVTIASSTGKTAERTIHLVSR